MQNKEQKDHLSIQSRNHHQHAAVFPSAESLPSRWIETHVRDQGDEKLVPDLGPRDRTLGLLSGDCGDQFITISLMAGWKIRLGEEITPKDHDPGRPVHRAPQGESLRFSL